MHIVNIVPSSTGCAGNLNRKARIAKVRFPTAMHELRGKASSTVFDGKASLVIMSYAYAS